MPSGHDTAAKGHTTVLANIIPAGAWSASTPSGKGYSLKGQIEVGSVRR